jgi:hypothetical protein
VASSPQVWLWNRQSYFAKKKGILALSSHFPPLLAKILAPPRTPSHSLALPRTPSHFLALPRTSLAPPRNSLAQFSQNARASRGAG